MEKLVYCVVFVKTMCKKAPDFIGGLSVDSEGNTRFRGTAAINRNLKSGYLAAAENIIE